MRNYILPFLAIGILITSFSSCNGSSAKTEATPPVKSEISKDSLVKRGGYLVAAIGCDDCHSPKTMGPQGPQLDLEHRLSGYPQERPIAKVDGAVVKNGWNLFGSDLTSAVGPWGMSFSSNITSDSTGIGNWSEAQFIKAMREGKSKGLDSARPILPPMPWQNFKNLSDEDLSAIYAYLQSTKPVHNVVPAPRPLAQL